MYGLNPDVISRLQEVFAVHQKVEKAILYGSRAKGNYRNGSDIDLTFEGNLDLDDIYSISHQIDDLNMPYLFDLSAFDTINDPDLVDHVRRVGKVFYEKGVV